MIRSVMKLVIEAISEPTVVPPLKLRTRRSAKDTLSETIATRYGLLHLSIVSPLQRESITKEKRANVGEKIYAAPFAV